MTKRPHMYVIRAIGPVFGDTPAEVRQAVLDKAAHLFPEEEPVTRVLESGYELKPVDRDSQHYKAFLQELNTGDKDLMVTGPAVRVVLERRYWRWSRRV